MTPISTTLAVSRSAGVVTVVMDWSGRCGVLGPEVAVELAGMLRRIAVDPRTGAVVLTGVGHVFAAGRDDLPEIDLLAEVIRRSPVPVVAAVQRVCIGAGLAVALACPRRFVAHDAILCPTPGAADRGAAHRLLLEDLGLDAARRLTSSGVMNAAILVEWGVDVQVVPAEDLLALAQEEAYALRARAVNSSPSPRPPSPQRRRARRTVWAVPDTRTTRETTR